jgi:selenide, water dikinase
LMTLKEDLFKHVLCDPQTSGGLMIAVEEWAVDEVERLLHKNNLPNQSFGEFVQKGDQLISVQ